MDHIVAAEMQLSNLFAFVRSTALPLAVTVLFTCPTRDSGGATPTPYEANVAPASNEAALMMKQLVLPEGFHAELFASEPFLANPVAFTVDEQGRFYVAETFRLHEGVTDIRGKDDWLDEDLASVTVDDRLAMMKRHLEDGIASYGVHHDRLKRIEDTDHDGRADRSTVFADGFNGPLEGLGAGVVARNGEVWYTALPDLWLLRDTDNDGQAEYRRSLHTGFGVRIGFLGHDLHGICFGPDGRLYFSIGDRGARVETPEGIVGRTDCGAVYRCNPDGSELEVFAFGLRNPQELAFDQYGNLFTGDNNSDGGDKARWVYLVEGGDSGWRIGYQFIESPNARGPWNSEKLWHPQWNGQAAFLVPPVANLGDGPSGLTYYPGTGMPDRYQDHFFLADFRGGKGSKIHSFGLKPKGATFEIADHEDFMTEGLPTDVGFGLDGGLYYTDWVAGWGMTGKGRIYRLVDPSAAAKPIVAETRGLISGGVTDASRSRCITLLSHPDQRVRQQAQFKLASMGRQAIRALSRSALDNPDQIARIHSLWGLAQILADASGHLSPREIDAASSPFLTLLEDQDPEIRAQAARALGDRPDPAALQPLIALLKDTSARVRFFAALGVGKLGNPAALQAVFQMLRENADEDPYLRHAGVMALTWTRHMPSLLDARTDPSPAVRMAVLIAMRRLQSPDIASFLQDTDPAIVLEAARAINDAPVHGAANELAAMLSHYSSAATAADLGTELGRRVLNANLRVGTVRSAERLARFASTPEAPEALRAEALAILANWEHPSGRDRLTGEWRPVVGDRPSRVAAAAVEPTLAALLTNSPTVVQLAAIQAAVALPIHAMDAPLLTVSGDQTLSPRVRAAALEALASRMSDALDPALEQAGSDPNEQVRKTAIRLGAARASSNPVVQLKRTLESGSIGEQQAALASLSRLESSAAQELLLPLLDRLIEGNLPVALQLDLLEAAEQNEGESVKQKLQAYSQALPSGTPLASFQVCLAGGDPERGRKIFFERAEVACMRCHKIAGEGGDVGPDLSTSSARKQRSYLLESILTPNKQIAEGFETLIITLKDGTAYAGMIKSENATELVINSPEDGLVTVARDEIESRTPSLSPMPEGMENTLTKRDLRDLIEFLGNLK
jgi:quinoprotein glucose dehydrogenase